MNIKKTELTDVILHKSKKASAKTKGMSSKRRFKGVKKEENQDETYHLRKNHGADLMRKRKTGKEGRIKNRRENVHKKGMPDEAVLPIHEKKLYTAEITAETERDCEYEPYEDYRDNTVEKIKAQVAVDKVFALSGSKDKIFKPPYKEELPKELPEAPGYEEGGRELFIDGIKNAKEEESRKKPHIQGNTPKEQQKDVSYPAGLKSPPESEKITPGINKDDTQIRINHGESVRLHRAGEETLKKEDIILKKGGAVVRHDRRKKDEAFIKNERKEHYRKQKERGFILKKKKIKQGRRGRKIKKAAVNSSLLAGGAAVIVLLLPVLTVFALIGSLLRSPFALMMPDEDNFIADNSKVIQQAKKYRDAQIKEAKNVAKKHEGCDKGKIVYEGMEGSVPDNSVDIVTIYAARYGWEKKVRKMNKENKENLKYVAEVMCPYNSYVETETITKEDGTTKEKTTLVVTISFYDYTRALPLFGLDKKEKQAADTLHEYFYNIKHPADGGESGGGEPKSSISENEIEKILKDVSDPKAKAACRFALSKVGYPYSQNLRDSGTYYDCSSLAYYSWKSAGVDISYGGANTAAAECQGLDVSGKGFDFSSVDDLMPGDLIFFSYALNGRYRDITHVAIYVGDGNVVEAADEERGVIYGKFNTKSIVRIGRP